MFAGGGAAMFDRARFIALGGFDPLLSPFYWEDVELSYRAWKRGLEVLYEPRSVVHHRVSSTIGKLRRSRVRAIQHRNRVIYHWIHLHDRGFLGSHAGWLLLLSVTAPVRLQFSFLAGLFAALRRLPAILARRAEENRAARRSDREIFEIFDALEKRPDVFAYEGEAELEEVNSRLGIGTPQQLRKP
jgi:GT2 family glycosyltransferase